MDLEKRTTLLGIDPSFINFGVCIYNPSTKDMNMKTGTMTKMVDWIQTQCKVRDCIAIVENPALDKTTFNMWGMMKKTIEKYITYQVWKVTKIGVIPPKIELSDIQTQFAIAMNFAQKVGENKAAAKHFLSILSDAKVPYIEIAPSKRQKAFTKKNNKVVRRKVLTLTMPTKTTQEQFKELTGYDKRSNEHCRDAATLVFGRTIKWAIMTLKMGERKGPIKKSLPAGNNGNFFLINSKANS